MSAPKYKFIATDKVSSMTDVERDLATIHTDDHGPEDHLCSGCLRLEKEECWAERHGEEPIEREEARKMSDFDSRDCHCGCHYLIDQCRFTQTSVKNDGRPMYRLETEQDGFSVILPAGVYDSFLELTQEQRDEAITVLLAQAKQVKQSNEEN